MADIPIPFATNAAEAARDVAALKRETLAAAEAADRAAKATGRQEKALRSIVTAQRAERTELAAMDREAARLTSRGGQLGRRFGEFRSNNPSGGGGANGGGHGFSAGGLRGIGHLGRLSGIPGLGELGGIGQAIAHLGPAAGYVALAAAALAPAAILFQRAGVKAEQAADDLKAAAAGHKLADNAFRAGAAAKVANAKGAFDAHGDDLLKLVARGGSADEARMLTRTGVSDATQGLGLAQLIDPEQRGDAVAAARRAAATGEGSFSEFLGLIKDHQISLSGDQTADVGALIGAKRGTVALNAGQVGFLETNLSSGVGLGLTQARGSRGRSQDATLGAALDTDSAINGYVDQADATNDPFAGPREQARASLEEAISAMQEAADQQSAVAARFATFLAKWGLSQGSARTQANRNEATTRSAAGF